MKKLILKDHIEFIKKILKKSIKETTSKANNINENGDCDSVQVNTNNDVTFTQLCDVSYGLQNYGLHSHYTFLIKRSGPGLKVVVYPKE